MKSVRFSATTTSHHGDFDRTTTLTVSVEYGGNLAAADAELRRVRLIFDDSMSDADRAAMQAGVDGHDEKRG